MPAEKEAKSDWLVCNAFGERSLRASEMDRKALGKNVFLRKMRKCQVRLKIKRIVKEARRCF